MEKTCFNVLAVAGVCFGMAALVQCGIDGSSLNPNDCTLANTCPGASGPVDAARPDADATLDAPIADEKASDDLVSGDAVEGGAGDDGSPPGDAAFSEVLTCPSTALLKCGGTCVDPNSPANCGNCTNQCPAVDAGAGHATCTGGVCGISCEPSSTPLDCNGACVDPHSDPMHCGGCGNVCAPPASRRGTAVCSAAPDGGVACGIMCTAGSVGSDGYHACNNDCLPNSDVPSNPTDPCVVIAVPGVFVSPNGKDNNAGTMTSPVKTIGHAMDLAEKTAGKRVYACGSAGSYPENLVVSTSRDGVKVYGGLDCSSAQWTYSASQLAVIAPTTAGYALNVTGPGISVGVTFEDMAFESQNAAGTGASSIAVFVSSASNVVLRRCTVHAGSGAQGQDPAQPAPYRSAAPAGNPGDASLSSGGTGRGGQQAQNPQCPSSIGGAGGSARSGEPLSQLDGQSGQPGPNNAGTSADCNAIPSSQSGGAGVDGVAGTAGAGASSWGSFSAANWTPAPGQVGGPGAVGQGGGGGGAAAAANAVGGGGGGGAGGCGGTGGGAGTGGGSSIAVLIYNSVVAMETSTLVAGAGARGGNGAAGQFGQSMGVGGSGGNAACDGGPGGQGGAGGAGGGGAGGLSTGVVWSGTAPTIDAATLMNVTLGAPGAGGTGAGGSNGGKPGVAQAILQFP